MKKKTNKKKHNSRPGKQNAKNMLIKGLLQSFFIVAILLGAGVLGYQTTMKLWMIDKADAIVANEATPTPVPITKASIDDISKNLIYCYDEENHEISKLVLEIFHCQNKQLTYITIPMSTQFTMSDTLYKKLILIHPSTPQMLRLSAMTKYIDTETVFDYGVLLVEDLLEIDISYYTVLPKELYDTIFSEQSIVAGSDAKSLLAGEELDAPDTSKDLADSGEQLVDTQVTAEVFTKDYMEFITTIKTAEELSTYIEDVYASLSSNLSVYDKMNYLESYCKTPLSKVTFDRLRGSEMNSGFVIDQNGVRLQLQQLTSTVIEEEMKQ